MTTAQHATVLIADDEPPARRRLRELLAGRADVTVVAECGNGVEAVRAIRERRPDIVFLDVRMPGLDGFEVVREIGPEAMPVVVFVTAFDRYALRAFEIHALDYLLKPFDDDRFEEALRRALGQTERRRLAELGRRLGRLLASDEQRASGRRIAIRSTGRVRFIDIAEIRWVESAGSYCRLHCDRGTHLLRQSLAALVARFSDELVRIHRSTLVRPDQVSEIRRRSHGDATVVLDDGTRLRASRRYRTDLERALSARDSAGPV